MPERILLLGSGAREHALATSLAASTSCEHLWCAPGNPGIWTVATPVDIAITDPDAVLAWCRSNAPTLVVVGPETPLAHGVTDILTASGFVVFGPSKRAAQLETSKGFAKDFMSRHHIPTATYARFVDCHEAQHYVRSQPLPIVVKYDGLAAGKGVVVATTFDEADEAVVHMFNGAYGTDGVVIEGFLHGVEASVFAICDGYNYITLAPCHDHKRIGDGDTGKNTGGMGAVCPSPRVNADIMHRIETMIIEPTLRGMQQEGTPFIGCLYCGVMIDAAGMPSVVEFNVRFGDPEAQVVLSVLHADVASLLSSAAHGALDATSIVDRCNGAAACVVLASGGYPDEYQVGHVITGIDHALAIEGVSVFHAGTKLVSTSSDEPTGTLITAGGRVLTVTAHSTDLSVAIDHAYQACSKIDFTNKYHRTDIGKTS